MEWRDSLPTYLKYEQIDGENQLQATLLNKENDAVEALDLPALSKRLYGRYEGFLSLPT